MTNLNRGDDAITCAYKEIYEIMKLLPKELIDRIRDGKCEFFEYEHYRCSAENQECTMVVRSDGKGYYSCSLKNGQRTHYSHKKFDDATEYFNTWKCVKEE